MISSLERNRSVSAEVIWGTFQLERPPKSVICHGSTNRQTASVERVTSPIGGIPYQSPLIH